MRSARRRCGAIDHPAVDDVDASVPQRNDHLLGPRALLRGRAEGMVDRADLAGVDRRLRGEPVGPCSLALAGQRDGVAKVDEDRVDGTALGRGGGHQHQAARQPERLA
jgi:hypothetical protein